jgi:hypothetical protein
VVRLKLTQGMVALIDDEDQKRVLEAAPRWHAQRNRRGGVPWSAAAEPRRRRSISLHRLIAGVLRKPHLLVRHLNGNGLDCRRANLLVITRQQRSASSSPARRRSSRSTTSYRGVYPTTKKAPRPWFAAIGVRGQARRYIGAFATAEAAARAYDAAAAKYFGAFARLNFPAGEAKENG